MTSAVAALFASACAPMNAGRFAAHDVPLAQYRTFAWGTADALPVGDPRLDRNPFFKDHFEGAVEKQLAKKGFEHAAGTPDLLLHYHASIDRQIDISGVDPGSGYCSASDCQPRLVEREAGTLILDVIDTRTSRLVWRGWAEDDMEGVLDHPDRFRDHIDRAVAKMLEGFPHIRSGERG